MLPHELEQRLPHRDLALLMHYAAKRMLPLRRQELYLAQVAMAVAKAVGGAREARLSDFMFDPPDQAQEPETEDEAIEEMRRALGFPPRN